VFARAALISLRLEQADVEALERAAAAEGIERSELLRRIIRRYLARRS
jgi:predicted DNA binding CopG/RHH family protein